MYLKNGFNINKPKKGKRIKFPEKFSRLKRDDLNPADTYTLGLLITKIDNIININNIDKKQFNDGLRICKVFRNKEGHVAVHWHDFDPDDYRKIEYAIIQLYRIGFEEELSFHISIKKDDIGKFNINKL